MAANTGRARAHATHAHQRFTPIAIPNPFLLFSDLTEATLTGASLSLAATVSIIMLLAMVREREKEEKRARRAAHRYVGPDRSTLPPTQELNGYLTPVYREELVVDRSPPGELLRVNFNVSFPSLSCEFATLDVSDSLGTKRLNLTKTVRKLPITEDMQRAGYYMHDDGASRREIAYDEEGTVLPAGSVGGDPFAAIDYTAPIDAAHFQGTVERYPIVVVNFYGEREFCVCVGVF